MGVAMAGDRRDREPAQPIPEIEGGRFIPGTEFVDEKENLFGVHLPGFRVGMAREGGQEVFAEIAAPVYMEEAQIGAGIEKLRRELEIVGRAPVFFHVSEMHQDRCPFAGKNGLDALGFKIAMAVGDEDHSKGGIHSVAFSISGF